MSDFKAKMHQIQDFRWGSATPLGSLQHSARPLAVFKGPTSKRKEREREGEGRGEKGGESCPQLGSLDPSVCMETI